MANNLILFTNRSGSTVLCDILSYANDTVNLGEGLQSVARSYNFNKEYHRETDLYKLFSQKHISSIYHNPATRGSDHVGYFAEKDKRTSILKTTSTPWTVKENTDKQLMDINFIDYCCKNVNTNVYLTHRKNIVDQFVSKINARYRSEILKQKLGTEFIYTNNDVPPIYNEMKINFHWLYMYTNVFIGQLMMWRIVYEMFRPHLQIVSYDNHIKPMNFEQFGISKETVEAYKSENQHLVPTPFNTKNVVILDDHPAPMVGAWEQTLYYISKFQYLVEIE